MKKPFPKDDNWADFRQLGQNKLYFKKQDFVRFTTDLEIYDLEDFSIEFATPNIVTMFLNLGETHYLKSRKIYETKLKHILKPNERNKIKNKSQIILYDYFEQTQMSVICSYNALEAFANLAISEDIKHTKENHKGITEVWNKDAILRWMSLSEKLTNILPNMLGIESPKGLSFWGNYKKLEKLRNEIIHPKTKSNELNVKHEFFKSFFSKDLSKWIFSTDEILKHFCSGEYREYYYPYRYGPKEQKAFELSDFDEYFAPSEEE